MTERRHPSVLVVSCSSTTAAKDLIAEITGIIDLVPSVEDDISTYEWKINTKYYAATVNLCAPVHRTVPSAEFAETVEAVVIHFNPEQRDSFSAVQAWLRTVEDLYSPSVKLLTCDRCEKSDIVSKEELTVFCVQNGLELIQLSPTEVDSDDEEFGSIHGVSRVRQALQAHSWSNLALKSRPMRRPTSSDSDTPPDSTDVPDTETFHEDEAGDADAVDDSFTQLFSRLHEFRATASTLSSDERKNFAERVAKDFLRSLDVDPEELSD